MYICMSSMHAQTAGLINLKLGMWPPLDLGKVLAGSKILEEGPPAQGSPTPHTPQGSPSPFWGTRRPPNNFLHKIKVYQHPHYWGPDEVKSDIRGHLEVKSEVKHLRLNGWIDRVWIWYVTSPWLWEGSSRVKILDGVPGGGGGKAYSKPQVGPNLFRGTRIPPSNFFHKIKVAQHPHK